MAEKIFVTAEIPLWLQLNKVSKKYMDALSSRLSGLGIRRHYFLIVAIGEGKGKLTQQDLADLLETDKVSMVGMLDSLTKSGFVKRTASREDRRKHLIVLTPKAEIALPIIKKTITELNQRALSGLPANFANQFPHALTLMKSELETVIRESEPGSSPSSAKVSTRTAKTKTPR